MGGPWRQRGAERADCRLRSLRDDRRALEKRADFPPPILCTPRILANHDERATGRLCLFGPARRSVQPYRSKERIPHAQRGRGPVDSTRRATGEQSCFSTLAARRHLRTRGRFGGGACTRGASESLCFFCTKKRGVKLSFAGKAKSNDLGEYRIYGLPAGNYLAEVWPPREGTPAGEYYAATAAAFYPNAPAPAQALPVKVRWGGELTGIDLELSESVTYSVAGTVGDATMEGPCFGCVVRAVRIDSSFVVSLPKTARVSPKGFFTLRGLSPGDYKIFSRRLGADEVSQRLVTLTDSNLEDVDLVAGRAQPVSGEIILEDPPEGVEATKWTAYVSSTVLPESWPDAKDQIGEDLRFHMESVSAETYRFEVLDLPPGAYLKALRVGGQRLPRPELTVAEDFPLAGVQALIAFDAATVTGQVRPRRSGGGSEGPIEARVALIPKANRGGYVTAKAVETTPDGSFSFASVVPGAYTLYAMPSMSAAQVMDPFVQSALRTYARAVALEPGGTITVELPLAPDPEGTY